MTSDNPASNAVDAALNQSDYRFAIHGVSTVRRRGRTRGSRSRQNQSDSASRSRTCPPYVASNINGFELSEFATPERLHSVFRILRAEGGPGPGTDGITYGDFTSSEIYAALRHVRGKLLAHEYTPHETRQVRIPKGDGRYRELQLHRILDRVIAKALQLALDTYWRAHLPRLGKDVCDVYAVMQTAMQQSDARFLVVSDIRDCFPSAPIDTVLQCYRRHISNADLLWLIETIVRGHDGSGHVTGMDQGSPISPVSVELLLHIILDTWFGTAFRGLPLLLRYVDNLNIVCRSVREGREALRSCEDILRDHGFTLKPERPPMDFPMDLRREHPNRKVLGLNPYWRNEQLHFTIPGTAYDSLRKGFAESIVRPNPVATALGVAEGWLGAMGPALTNAVTPATVDRVIRIARECGFTELRSSDLQLTCRLAHARWQVLTSEGSNRGDA